MNQKKRLKYWLKPEDRKNRKALIISLTVSLLILR